MKKLISAICILGLIVIMPIFAQEPQSSEEEVFLYKTIPGDSLWNISERHLTDIKLWLALKKENNLSNDDHIEPGTIIKIPHKWLKVNKSDASLINMMGDVSIIGENGEVIPLDDEMKKFNKIVLHEGATVRTGDDGLATILFVDGSRLFLQSNSELVLQDLIALGDGSLSNIKLKLEKGRVESRVHSSTLSNTNYEVITTVATTSVRGTDFRVSAGKGDVSVAEVVEGRVIAAGNDNNDNSIELNKGEGTFIGRDIALTRLVLPEAPTFDDFPKIIEHVPIKVEVASIEGIRGFDTAIVPVGEDPKNPVSSQITEGNTLQGADLPDGRYQMFVSAIDEKGLTGMPAMYEFILNARPFSPKMDYPASAASMVEKQLKFVWNKANDEAAVYHLQVAKDESFRDLVINDMSVSGEEYVATDHLGSGAYFWRIASVDQNNKRGPFTDPKDFRVLLETPNLQVANVATSNVTLRWDESEKGTQYTIQVATDVDFKSIVLEKTIEQNAIMLTDVKPNIYYFRIQTIAPDQFVSAWGVPQKFEIPDNTEVPVRVSLSGE